MRSSVIAAVVFLAACASTPGIPIDSVDRSLSLHRAVRPNGSSPSRSHTFFTDDDAADVDLNWAFAKTYYDLGLVSGHRLVTAVTQAGIPAAAYFDFNDCGSSRYQYPLRYQNPDCNAPGAPWAASDYYRQNGQPLTKITTYSNATVQQDLVDPGRADVQSRMAKAATVTLAPGQDYTYQYVDDAYDVDSTLFYDFLVCEGVGPGAHAAPSPTCGSGNHPILRNTMDVSAYSQAEWQSGETAVSNAMTGAVPSAPILFNGVGGINRSGAPSDIMPTLLAANNVWGGECQNCFYQLPAQGNDPRLLAEELADVITAIGHQKNVIIDNGSLATTDARMTALAKVALTYSYAHTYFASSGGSMCGAASHIFVCAETGLIFESPAKAYPTALADLSDGGSLYIRRFNGCRYDGVERGPCVAVVNPTATSRAIPARDTFPNVATITGTGNASLCGCDGDARGGMAAVPSTIGSLSQGGAVVFFKRRFKRDPNT